MGLAELSLVAVNRSVGFWSRMGFGRVELAADRLTGYGADAAYMVKAVG